MCCHWSSTLLLHKVNTLVILVTLALPPRTPVPRPELNQAQHPDTEHKTPHSHCTGTSQAEARPAEKATSPRHPAAANTDHHHLLGSTLSIGCIATSSQVLSGWGRATGKSVGWSDPATHQQATRAASVRAGPTLKHTGTGHSTICFVVQGHQRAIDSSICTSTPA